MIVITEETVLEENELQWEFVRSGGPGGQNVNKVATAVQLKFDVHASRTLSPDVKERLARLAGKRMTTEGVLIIKAQRFRTQERNREDALDRLREIIIEALKKPRKRIRTRPTKSSRIHRLESKRKSGVKKGMRHAVPPEES